MKTLTTAEANAQGLTAQRIATNLEAYEAARSSFFVFMVEDLDNLMHPNFTGGIDDDTAKDSFYDAAKAQEAIKLNVTRCDVPRCEVSVLDFKRGNDTVHFAGNPTWSNGGEIVIDDFVGVDTKSIMQAWFRLAYDWNTFKGGRMKDYKKTCTLMEYTQDYQLIRTWTIYGCFVSSISEDPFDKTQDGKRQLRARLVYDRARPELPEER